MPYDVRMARRPSPLTSHATPMRGDRYAALQVLDQRVHSANVVRVQVRQDNLTNGAPLRE